MLKGKQGSRNVVNPAKLPKAQAKVYTNVTHSRLGKIMRPLDRARKKIKWK